MASQTARARALVAEIRDRLLLLDVEMDKIEPPAATNTLRIKPGDDVGAAFKSLYATGGIILAQPGEYLVQLELPERPEKKQIIFTTDTQNLPQTSVRIGADFKPGLATLRSKNALDPAFTALAKSGGVTFAGMAFGPQALDRTVIDLGTDVFSDPAQMPSDFAFDRVLFYGDPAKGQHRGIMAHARNLSVTNSYMQDFCEPGRDSQCIAAWNGGRNILIDNNTLEGGAENVLFGGAPARSADLIPADIRITRNYFNKPVRWQSFANVPSIKTLLEIKNVRRLFIEGNVFDGCWSAARPGGAWSTGVGVVFKVSPNGSLFTVCEDVTFVRNVIRNVGAVWGIVGSRDGDEESDRMKNTTIAGNLAYNINVAGSPYTGDGRMLPIANPPISLHVEHNTVRGNGNTIMNWWAGGPAGTADGKDVSVTNPIREPGVDLRLTDNVVNQGEYGIHCTAGLGKTALDVGWPNSYVMSGNAIKRNAARTVKFPDGNPIIEQGAHDASFDAEHKVIDGSLVAAVVTTDGKRVGADIEAIKRVLAPTERL